MIHYNSNNNIYCRAVNAETFQTIEPNPVWISILLYRRNPYSYSHFEIVICIYSVRGDIDQMSTNTSSYTICSVPNVYIFVYILIETRTAPLNSISSLFKYCFCVWKILLECAYLPMASHDSYCTNGHWVLAVGLPTFQFRCERCEMVDLTEHIFKNKRDVVSAN